MNSIDRYDRDETEIILDNQRHLIKLHDTAGQEDYERLRQIIYKEVIANNTTLVMSQETSNKCFVFFLDS